MRKPAAAVLVAPACTEVADALGRELAALGLADHYEARIAVQLAGQLDDGSVRGAGFVSLSKELDRRVEALRLKAERPDDPTKRVHAAVEEKRAHLKAV